MELSVVNLDGAGEGTRCIAYRNWPVCLMIYQSRSPFTPHARVPFSPCRTQATPALCVTMKTPSRKPTFDTALDFETQHYSNARFGTELDTVCPRLRLISLQWPFVAALRPIRHLGKPQAHLNNIAKLSRSGRLHACNLLKRPWWPSPTWRALP